MTDNEEKFENFARQIKFDDTPNYEHRDKLEKDLLFALQKQQRRQHKPFLQIWRPIMKTRIVKLAAAILLIAALVITLLEKSTPTAYAIEQTVEAFKNVRFLHLISCDQGGQIEDERWIELGLDGRQVRYRQEKPPVWLDIEDGKTTAVYYKDKQTVVLYDGREKQYQWIGDLGSFLENLRQKGEIIAENVNYKGQISHLVLWPMMNAQCYIDPATKLPIAIGTTHLSYEQPPPGTFEITIPENYTVIDKRLGAEAASEPNWLAADTIAGQRFAMARHALAAGDYATAAELFEYVVQIQPGRNWAWFWLGSSYYALGQYDLAIAKYSKIFGMMGGPPYLCYARGLAYYQKGALNEAKQDFAKALPWMIQALRERSAAVMFEYADDPLLRDGRRQPTEQQILTNMINRLREVTGGNFGYDSDASAEENEQAITAWENWWAEHAADYNAEAP